MWHQKVLHCCSLRVLLQQCNKYILANTGLIYLFRLNLTCMEVSSHFYRPYHIWELNLLWLLDLHRLPAPAELTLCTATWLQAPGAAPQSTTLYPGCKILNLSSISKSLKALLQRKFWACEAFTYGSLSCLFTQRCSAAVFPFSFFIAFNEQWKHLFWTERVHIFLFSGILHQ